MYFPHAFIDVFLALREEMRPPLPLGDQHDAQEGLETLLQHTPMCSALFDAGSGGHCPFFVNLPSFEETGWWFMNHMTEGGALINMTALLQDGFGRLVDKLKKVPPMPVAILPAYAHRESDDEDWWLGNLVGAQWGDGVVDLSAGFDPECEQRLQAVYRLLSFVEYEGDHDIVPAGTICGGHSRAYFREDACWYCADDSKVNVVAAEGEFPSACPYICFFERVDLPQSDSWPPLPCSMEDASDDEVSEIGSDVSNAEQSDAAPPDAVSGRATGLTLGKRADAATGEAPLKRLRVRGKQPPSTSSAGAVVESAGEKPGRKALGKTLRKSPAQKQDRTGRKQD